MNDTYCCNIINVLCLVSSKGVGSGELNLRNISMDPSNVLAQRTHQVQIILYHILLEQFLRQSAVSHSLDEFVMCILVPGRLYVISIQYVVNKASTRGMSAALMRASIEITNGGKGMI